MFARRLCSVVLVTGGLLAPYFGIAATNREVICDVARTCARSGPGCAPGSTCNTSQGVVEECRITVAEQGRCVTDQEQRDMVADAQYFTRERVVPGRVERTICCRCRRAGSGDKCVTFTNVSDCGMNTIDRHPSMISLQSQGANAPVTCDEEKIPDSQCLTVANGGSCQNTPTDAVTAFTTQASTPSLTDQVSDTLTQAVRPSITPNLSVPIPGLTFSSAEKAGGTVRVSFLGQYIAAVYRYAVSIVVVVATIMVVYGGFLYLISPIAGDASRGMEIIKDALMGTVVLLAAYLILQTINPRLTDLESLNLNYIARTEYGEGEGQNEAVRDISSGACAELPRLASIRSDQMIAVPRYYQFASPWGGQAFGRNLIGQSELPACTSASTQSQNCTGTFGQGACGVTSLASVLAYYNVQGANGRITPLDTGAYAVRNGFRPHNAGTTPGAFCSDAFRREYPGFECESLGSNVTRAIQALRNHQPVIFHCARCAVTLKNGQPGFGSRGSGHYMVLTGVSDDGQTFAIHDVGHADGTAAAAISAAVLRTQSMWLIYPRGSAPGTSTTGTRPATPGTGTVAAAGACAPTGGQSAITATSGDLTIAKFAYRPNGNTGWQHEGSPLVFPTRLANQTADVQLFIYLHGLNTHANTFETSGYWREIRPELQRVAGSHNVVFVAPHFQAGSNYYSGFTFSSFYSAVTAALAANPATRQLRVDRIVIGGHSAATCQGSPVPLRDAMRNKPANTRGVVAFDGCLGTELKQNNFSDPGGFVFFNPDLSGMGIDRDTTPPTNRYLLTRESYGLVSHACPPYVGRGVACFKHPTEQWWSFETRLGHAESVQEMTKYLIQGFFPPVSP